MSNTYHPEDIIPSPGYVIVKPSEVINEVAGIYNPNADKEVPQWGTIVRVGDVEITREGVKVGKFQVGETVIYRKWGGNDVEIGNHKYYFLKFDEIIGVVRK